MKPINTTHGHTIGRKRSPTFSSWHNMIARCTYPSNPAYQHYQKLGIKVCDRWLTFQNFLDDMGERPPGNYTLDRWPNNNGNYEPGNCRWATKEQQANNRRTNMIFIYQGKEYTMAELARHTGVSKEILRIRIGSRAKFPWTVEGAVKTPKLTRSSQGFYC